MDALQIFTEEVKAEIVKAIEIAENETSGEIKLHVENTCEGDVMDRAAFLFDKLKMHKTDLRNGVLFYVATTDKKFAVLGDIGISEKVDGNYWNELRDIVLSNFKKSEYGKGLSEGIIKAGEQLKTYFPFNENDVNELDNEISFEE
jgi:uncharacterized membrane protein